MCATMVNGYSVKPHCIVGFAWDLSGRKRNVRPVDNKNDGVLSEKQAYKLRNAINWLQYLSEGKFYTDPVTKQKYALRLNMITLTLCAEQMHPDTYIYHKLVRPFLKWLQRKGATHYVWRAEAQSNGRIHFHITCNRYVRAQSIQLKWNSLLQEHGYIRAYIQSGGDENPPSTDVTGNKQSHKLAKYLVKYMSKRYPFKHCQRYCVIKDKPKVIEMISDYVLQQDNSYDMVPRPIECKLWGCSLELSQQRRNISELDKYWQIFQANVYRETKRLVESNHDIRLYNSLTARDYFFTLQRNTEHVSPVTLHNEQIRAKRVPCKLGGDIKARKAPGRVYMPTLWSEAERIQKRPEALLPCDYKCRAFRPVKSKSQRRKSN